MEDSLVAEMTSHAQFVAGKPPQRRRADDPAVKNSINNAVKFIRKIENNIENPRIASGTVAEPQTILTLYWHVGNVRGVYGINVEFKNNNTCAISWEGPGNYKNYVQNVSVDDLIKLNIPRIFNEIVTRSRPYRIDPQP